MKKAKVVTYCEWSSYGSILQSLGLKKALLNLECESSIIKKGVPLPLHYVPKYISGYSLRTIAKNAETVIMKRSTAKRYESCMEFIKENIDLEYYSNEELEINPPEADLYIAGSDQIWHPELNEPLFFLDFGNGKVPRISYAASTGVSTISDTKKETIRQNLKNFDAVSVREESDRSIIDTLTEKSVQVNIDPTFLPDAMWWKTKESVYPKIEKPYILVYPIYWDKKFNRELKQLHRKTGYEIVLVASQWRDVYATRKLYDVSVSQFLYLLDNAEGVVTSSFHGVAFSIIFHKKFSAIINPACPSRLMNILNVVKSENATIQNVLNTNRNYEIIEQHIINERIAGMQFLKEALSI